MQLLSHLAVILSRQVSHAGSLLVKVELFYFRHVQLKKKDQGLMQLDPTAA